MRPRWPTREANNGKFRPAPATDVEHYPSFDVAKPVDGTTTMLFGAKQPVEHDARP